MADKPKLSEEQIKELKDALDVAGGGNKDGQPDGHVRVPDLKKIAGEDSKVQRSELNDLLKDKTKQQKDTLSSAFDEIMGGKGKNKELSIKELAAKLREAGVMEPLEKDKKDGPGKTPKKDKSEEKSNPAAKKGGGMGL